MSGDLAGVVALPPMETRGRRGRLAQAERPAERKVWIPPQRERLWAVVPIFDEAATIGAVVKRLRRLCPVIVVDDASTDGSGARAAAAGAACVIRHPRRMGKGAALRTGFAEALRRGAVSVATLDGDGQHDPADLPQLLAAAHAAPEALVVGDRLGGEAGDRMPPWRFAAVRTADWVLRCLTGSRIRDTQCGFRIYPAVFLGAVALREEGFVLETEAIVRAVRGGRRVVSAPVRRVYPSERTSRFRAVPDSLRIGWYLAREVVHEGRRRLRDVALAGRLGSPVRASDR